jgi:hypothetical protein
MKPYFYSLNHFHRRTGELTATTVGVVMADEIKQAEEKAWKKSGGDSSGNFDIKEVPEDGFSYYMMRKS